MVCPSAIELKPGLELLLRPFGTLFITLGLTYIVQSSPQMSAGTSQMSGNKNATEHVALVHYITFTWARYAVPVDCTLKNQGSVHRMHSFIALL